MSETTVKLYESQEWHLKFTSEDFLDIFLMTGKKPRKKAMEVGAHGQGVLILRRIEYAWLPPKEGCIAVSFAKPDMVNGKKVTRTLRLDLFDTGANDFCMGLGSANSTPEHFLERLGALTTVVIREVDAGLPAAKRRRVGGDEMTDMSPRDVDLNDALASTGVATSSPLRVRHVSGNSGEPDNEVTNNTRHDDYDVTQYDYAEIPAHVDKAVRDSDMEDEAGYLAPHRGLPRPLTYLSATSDIDVTNDQYDATEAEEDSALDEAGYMNMSQINQKNVSDGNIEEESEYIEMK